MRGLGRSTSAPLGRVGALRAVFVAAALTLGGVGLIGATGAAAGPALTQAIPLTYGGMNACTGETFVGTGTAHFLTGENLSASGAIQHHLDVTIDGLQAVTPTGKKYVVQDIYNEEFVFSSAAEETFDVTAHFVRVGEDGSFVLGDDFYDYLRTHITANANGIVTAVYIRTNDMPCQ